MDAATLTASVTSFLAPYLLKAGQTFASQAVEQEKGKESVGIHVHSGAVATRSSVVARQGGIAVGGSVGRNTITGNNNVVTNERPRKRDGNRPKSSSP